MIVVDTQILWYSVHLGEFTELVSQVSRKDARWIAPPLWRSEFRNTVAGYIRRGSLNPAEGIEMVERGQGLLSTEQSPETARILSLVPASRCTAYDLEFVAVAQALGIPLVTSDRQVLDSFPAIAVSLEAFVDEPA